jgi:hypothetical protein
MWYRKRLLVQYVLCLGMALEPGAGIGTARLQHEGIGAGMVHDLLHQPPGRAGAAQSRVGLDMGKNISAVANAIIGLGLQPVFFQFEALFGGVVDHVLRAGSRYIHLNDSPMGTIHSVPARA